VDLCNYCALCPCPNIRESIIAAKSRFVDQEGLPPSIRILQDVERVGRACGAAPRLSNALLQGGLTGPMIKKAAGIHPGRKFPHIPDQSFPAWIKKQGLDKQPSGQGARKVAYFSGCTARRLFPEVGRAAAEVLQQNGVEVWYPEQGCCGMPGMLEGGRAATLAFAGRTISLLAEAVDQGYAIVTSCPTCGYMLKKAVPDRAHCSEAFQALVGGTRRHLKVPDQQGAQSQAGPSARPELSSGWDRSALETACVALGPGGADTTLRLRTLDKPIYGQILKDDGYFSSIDPMARIKVAKNTHDLGEYLLGLHNNGALCTRLGPVPGKKVYYPPCHQREQGMGAPYMDLLGLIPGMDLTSIDNYSYCCGIGGIMGFKRQFHDTSLAMGGRLMAKIDELSPDQLVTDCLSCRLQFNQMSAYPVEHPVEILRDAYASHDLP
jgi:glycerol-3-phosphate dehydrogenase subunit C